VRTFCRVLTGLYIVLCGLALAAIPFNAAGLAGEPDPLSGIFAVVLAAPWIWFVGPIISESGTFWNMLVAGGCMVLNALLLWSLCHWLASVGQSHD
jgi:hypothetical protein